MVLFRIEHFQQGRRRIATEIGAHLVDFIEQEQGIAHADFRQRLQNLARHRADVGAAMAADFRFVAYAAQGHAHELAVRRAGDGLAQRGLADARRTDKAQDRRFELVDALLHREVFQDAFLDLVEAVVVAFEHFFRIRQVVIDLGFLFPWQVDQGVDVVAHDGGFGRHRRHQLEFFQLVGGFVERFLRHLGRSDFFLQLVEVGAIFALAQFFLDRLDLLVQVVLALRLFHLALDAAADALFHLQDVEFAFELAQQVLEALGHAENFQDDLFLLQLQGQMRSHRVGQAAGIIDARQGREDFRWNLFVQFDVLVELLHDRAAHGFDFRLVARLGLERRQVGDEVRRRIADVVDTGTLRAFDQHLDGAIGQLQHLQNIGDTANFIDIRRRRLVLRGCFLSGKHDALALLHRSFQRLDRLWTANEQRYHHMRENDDIPQRQ